MLAGVHPDLTWVEPRGAHDILVDDVRQQGRARGGAAAVRGLQAGLRDRRRRAHERGVAERAAEDARGAVAVRAFRAGQLGAGPAAADDPLALPAVRFGPVPAGADRGAAGRRRSADAQLADACARLSGGDVVKARWLAGEGADQRRRRRRPRARSCATTRGRPSGRSPSRGDALLERAAESGAARGGGGARRSSSSVLENEPKQGPQRDLERVRAAGAPRPPPRAHGVARPQPRAGPALVPRPGRGRERQRGAGVQHRPRRRARRGRRGPRPGCVDRLRRPLRGRRGGASSATCSRTSRSSRSSTGCAGPPAARSASTLTVS